LLPLGAEPPQGKRRRMIRKGLAMPLKDILTFIPSQAGAGAAASCAIALASLCDAHLTGASLVTDVSEEYSIKGLPASLLTALTHESNLAANAAGKRFEREAGLAGCRAEGLVIQARPSGLPALITRLARHFDLSVVDQPAPDDPPEREDVLYSVLFGSGRAVLAVPYIQQGPLRLDNVIVAWDGSETAAQALGAALPLLHFAKRIRVVTVPTASSGAVDFPGLNITRHLARHGLSVELKVVPTTIETGNALLSLAAEEGADLLVMGAYGHSRLRELVLGGTTLSVLRSMTLPVLMAH
jgi:nucleotide-binding universal stress UspA family protein